MNNSRRFDFEVREKQLTPKIPVWLKSHNAVLRSLPSISSKLYFDQSRDWSSPGALIALCSQDRLLANDLILFWNVGNDTNITDHNSIQTSHSMWLVR